MSTINSLSNNGFFSLNNQSTKDSSALDGIAQLQQAITAAKSGGASADNSYLLNLSAEAQAYIQSLATGNDTASTSPQASKASSSSTFILNRPQQKTLDAILEKYKDAPYTEATFTAIQKDLDAAGLSADTLGAQDKVRNFNATKFLLDALNGTESNESSPLDMLTGKSSDDEKTANADKYYNFMSGVVDRWKAISTTAAAADKS